MRILSNTTATDPFAPPFLDFLLGFSSASKCRKQQSLPYMHPVSHLSFWHTGGCQQSHDGSVHFHLRIFLHGIRHFLLKGLSPLGPRPFEGFLSSVCDCAFGARELACIFCRRLLPYCKSLLLNTVHLLFTESVLSLSSQRWLWSLFDSWSLLCFNPFVPSFEVARPYHLIIMSCHCCLQSGIARLVVVSNILLFTQSHDSLKLNRIPHKCGKVDHFPLSWCVQNNIPFGSSSRPITKLVSFRASSIPCTLLPSHLEISSLEASEEILCTKL